MQDEPGDDHEGEEDVEKNRDRKVRNTEVEGGRIPDATPRSRGSADGRPRTRCYVNDLSPLACGELKYGPKEARCMGQGKAMTQMFTE